ncbi:MFS transporter [Alicyclobacillus fastidiosus]|uniref:MFS transporter n=1 Tax=Alicyclobacillus fastidiosus TaxID=392011 RepID=A0ABY6ZCV6_9BACL|nr:MFS transporter [Alicyclobacillus fastidiosus]WAH40570.1 MFS transporter [Alicyclobacillus fastidiosus]GMA62005.1 MFS transporter [Alicyclobacillus fastidiosus]
MGKVVKQEYHQYSTRKTILGLDKNAFLVTLTSFLGWTMVNMDSSFFSNVYPLIQKDLHLANWTVGAITATMAVAACFATLIAGPLSDYLGRKVVFQFTILFTALGSALSALSGGFVSLLIARCLTMAGNASEWMIGQVMVTEGTPSKSRGWWTGVAQVGFPVGWFLTAVVVAHLAPVWGWRGVFWAGLIPIFLILVTRFFVKESDRFEDLKQFRQQAKRSGDADAGLNSDTTYSVNKEEATQFTYRQLFNPDLRRTTILLWIWQFVYNYGLFCVAYFLPSIASAHGFTLSNSWMVSAWGTGVGAVGYLVAAFLGNIVGRRIISLVWLFLGGVAGTFFAFGIHSINEMAFWWAAYYFFTVGHMGAYVPYMLESFPTRARGTGASLISFSNWVALFLAGVTSQWMVHSVGVNIAAFLWLGVAVWIAFVCGLGTRKIKPGLDLEEIIS